MSYKKRPCPICGELMKAWSNRRTCSHKCRQKAYRLSKKNPTLKVGKTTVGKLSIRCVNCGDKIPNPRLDQMYCNAACKMQMYRQRRKWANEPELPVQMSIPESAYTIENSIGGYQP